MKKKNKILACDNNASTQCGAFNTSCAKKNKEGKDQRLAQIEEYKSIKAMHDLIAQVECYSRNSVLEEQKSIN